VRADAGIPCLRGVPLHGCRAGHHNHNHHGVPLSGVSPATTKRAGDSPNLNLCLTKRCFTVLQADGFGDYCQWVSYSTEDEAPKARFGHTLVSYENKMVLFGGYDGSFSNTYMDDMWMWDFTGYAEAESERSEDTQTRTIGENFDIGKWRVVKQTGPGPSGRYGHVAAMVDTSEYMVVFSGNSGGSNLLNDLWSFNLVTLLWDVYYAFDVEEGRWPKPRSGASGASVDSSIFIFGGWSSNKRALSELWELKADSAEGLELSWVLLTNGQAEPVPSLGAGMLSPPGRYGHAAIRVNVDLMVRYALPTKFVLVRISYTSSYNCCQ
jgi:hypothetical protein